MLVQVRKLFQQLFSFVNVQLFNQLLLRRECCSFSNGEYVKTGLAEVENWIHSAGKDWTGESWDELRYIRQVPCCPHTTTLIALLHEESFSCHCLVNAAFDAVSHPLGHSVLVTAAKQNPKPVRQHWMHLLQNLHAVLLPESL